MTTTTHQLLLQPTDVLFFRDGRPMEGAAAGHGSAWPLPHVLDAALHHALRRAGLKGLHQHRLARNGKLLSEDREKMGREFGSLQSAGPFPVLVENDGTETWHFPRPLDAQGTGSETTHRPFLSSGGLDAGSSNALHPVINTKTPSKNQPAPWFNLAEFTQYLTGEANGSAGKSDHDLFESEHTIGIGMNPETQTALDGAFYSASFLRLRPETRLGLLTHCHDKRGGDLVEKAFTNSGSQTHIIVGGQQRTGTLARTTPNPLPLPMGQREDFPTVLVPGTSGLEQKHLVRWILLTPAIFPQILADPSKDIPPHPGGSLPTWIDPTTKEIRLRTRPTRQVGQSRAAWRDQVAKAPFVAALLVAALVGKALPVTGWAATAIHEETKETDRSLAGARSTHLAVPAGSVYYFACDTAEAARTLADALNWHGDADGAKICNRRSSLLGEKGYGLGVCAPWRPHPNHSSHSVHPD